MSFRSFVFASNVFRCLGKSSVDQEAIDLIEQVAKGEMTLVDSPAEVIDGEILEAYVPRWIAEDKKTAQSILDDLKG